MSNVSKPFMYDVGLTKEFVIAVFSSHYLFLTLAKVSTGVCFDRFGLKWTYGTCCVASLIALVSLSFVSPEMKILSWVYSVISSAGLPLETVMIPLMVMEMFGMRSFSHVMGYYLALNTLGYAIGVPLANLAFDKTGSYQGYLFILTFAMAVVTVVSMICIFIAAKKRKEFLAEHSAA